MNVDVLWNKKIKLKTFFSPQLKSSLKRVYGEWVLQIFSRPGLWRVIESRGCISRGAHVCLAVEGHAITTRVVMNMERTIVVHVVSAL